ncbi:unnamed protein product [Paramecium primaurelia]|uniref:Uncharacterized protein n=1 Tax=Paramecium primaurelia TaxID=5886 RepID=A0A8S1NIF0_PARPR|nr:unnamed protein product [Paramecium primaurelia]
MSLLKCQQNDHEESQILGVCINEKCKNLRPYCIGCKVEFHKGHENDLKQYGQLQSWIDQCLKSYQNLINFQGFILQLSNLLNETMNLLYSQKNQDIDSMGISQLENFIKKLMGLQSIEKQVNFQINNLTNEINTFKSLIKTVLNTLRIIDNENLEDKSLKKEQIQIQNIKPLKQDLLVFSEKYRAIQNIQIQNNGKQACGIGYVLCDYVIPKNEEKILKFKFVSGFSIALGLCHLEKPIESNYQDKLKNIGHGLYIIQSNSMSYSHLDASINNKSHQKIKIYQESIISLKIQTKQQLLTWIINNEEIFTMKIDTTKDLYPIIDICGIVEIVEDY